MEVIKIDDVTWPIFLEKIKGREMEHYWHIIDWTESKSKTVIYGIYDDGELIGSLLDFDGKFFQMRGEVRACKVLLGLIRPGHLEINYPLEAKDVIMPHFIEELGLDLVIMSLEIGNERLSFTEGPVILGIDDGEDIINLLRRSDNRMWSDANIESIEQSLRNGRWYGIRKEGLLVAAAGSSMIGFAININIVAVDADHRCKGFARTLVSSLLKDIFKKVPMAVIHARANNEPAIRAYKSVGFEVRHTYRFLRGNKI